MSVEQLYERHVKPLQPAERLRLAAMITQELATTAAHEKKLQRSLLELEGLGAEIWEGIDAQEYVNQLRAEWDHRP
jgi:hypothetical protein